MKNNAPQFICGDAQALPFQRAEFDICWCERVLQHTKNPVDAIQEMIRVTRPGGLLLIAESDWHSLSIDHADILLERNFVKSLASLIPSPSIGRHLYSALCRLGMENVTAEVMPLLWTDYIYFKRTSLSFPDLIAKLYHCTGESFAGFIQSLNHPHFFATASVVLTYCSVPSARSP